MPRAAVRRRQAGLSIVELMVGVTVGLIVVAAATVMVSGQLAENRRLLIETQMQQDLRAAADIIAREIRRQGALQENTGSSNRGVLETVFSDRTPFNVGFNPFYFGGNTGAMYGANITVGGLQRQVMFNYSAVDVQTAFNYLPGPYGFDLVGNAIRTRLPGSSDVWQPLTDPKLMKVTSFTVVESPAGSQASERIPCPTACPDGTTNCWPLVRSRELEVTIEAEAVSDSTVKRAIMTRVRLRNDEVKYHLSFAVTPPQWQVCPP
jgi:type II secretory pathway component PulJ